MLERFTRERQRASKGIEFNLEDEEELTHFGQSLSKLDDFNSTGFGSDDDGAIDGEVVKRTHFGGFEDEPNKQEEPDRKKSKAEVMAEIISKSKEHKMLRKMEREHGDNVRLELDQDFVALRSLIDAQGPPFTDGNPSFQPALLNAPSAPDDYDQNVRELAFDKRAKAKDRTKTEEELALEEKEALEKAERRRQKRMMGLMESDSEDDGPRRRKRKRGGDDLEDDFVEEDPWDELGEGLRAETDVHRGQPNSDGGDGSDPEISGMDDGCSTSLDPSLDASETSESEPGEHENIVTVLPSDSKENITARELPFTFPCPKTHEEFLSIIDDMKDIDVPVVIQRIRTLYHTSLGPDNKFKLQGLTNIVIDHILHITSLPEPQFEVVSSLFPHVEALVTAYPVQAAEYFVKKFSIMHKNHRNALSQGSLDMSAKTWPGLPELMLLRITGLLWSTSDLNHAVVSPARILMGAYLGLGRVRCLADIASGLFICTLFLQFEAISKRLVPEAVNFLMNATLHIAPHTYHSVKLLPGSFASPDFRSEMCRKLELYLKADVKVISRKANLANLLSQTEPQTEQAKVDLLNIAFELVEKYAEMYKSLDGFVELWDPIVEILQNVDTNRLPEFLQVRMTALIDLSGRLLKFARQERQPLYLQAHKPIPIPNYIPKFESLKSSYLRHRDPDHERNESVKLRRQYKEERKGAIRELRKDARFLASVEQEEQKEKDRRYQERMKRVFSSIESERAEQKSMEREKAKAKRRAGRK